ncbi:MAG: hypothetical protein H6832_12845 [Planctomycetes bacterium]|nr:hypothetical protein [Planctomycetota bacterium]
MRSYLALLAARPTYGVACALSILVAIGATGCTETDKGSWSATSSTGDDDNTSANVRGTGASATPTLWLVTEERAADKTLDLVALGEPDVTAFDWCTARVLGEQWLLSPDSSNTDGRVHLSTRIGDRRGSSVFCVTVADRIETSEKSANRRVLRSAKACAYVRRGTSSDIEASPVACARFGTAFEIVPLRDPVQTDIGGSLPIRLRFDAACVASTAAAQEADGWISSARVFVREDDPSGDVVLELAPGSAGVLDVPVHRSGRHCIEARLDIGDTTCIATLTFCIGERG